jgi:hypothetical protein
MLSRRRGLCQGAALVGDEGSWQRAAYLKGIAEQIKADGRPDVENTVFVPQITSVATNRQ